MRVEIEIDSIWYNVDDIGLIYDDQIISGFVEDNKPVSFFMSSIIDGDKSEINVRIRGRLHLAFTNRITDNYVEIFVNPPK